MKRKESSVVKKVYLPPELAGKIELLIHDPMYAKARYGLFSQITASLWQDYLAKLNRGEATIPKLEETSP